MINMLIIIAALILLAALLYSERKASDRLVLITKTPLSVLFLLTALIQPHPAPWYFYFLFAGLIFCLIGDICLALTQEKAFMAGLAAFLLGHLLYLVSFISLASLFHWFPLETLAVLVVSAAVFLWLRPHLQSMLLPVLAYVIVISVMLCGAWAVFKSRSFAFPGPLFIFAGAFFFYFSDLFVARNRFIKDEYLNRLLGLPLYYLGQFLLAFSVGLI